MSQIQNIDGEPAPIFYYFLCNPGSEKFLKEEIRLIYPELAFAYSTEGFLTFKETRRLGKTLRPVFCRHFGRFIKRGTLEEIRKQWVGKAQFYSIKGEIYESHAVQNGDWVKEIIKVTETQYYLGEFRASLLTAPTPGGFSIAALPEAAPSRAYLKVIDGLNYMGVELPPNDYALEIGSSPGGATFALLEGIDPGLMDPICTTNSKFTHHRQSIQDFHVSSLKDHVQWLYVDMNLAPEGSLREIEKVVEAVRPSLKGAFITLKMTKFELVSRVPMYLNIVGKMGLKVVMATQLPSHKQEFLIFAE
jgi:23S rRNA (cytidine2498-2'-O)-methyltransferase